LLRSSAGGEAKLSHDAESGLLASEAVGCKTLARIDDTVKHGNVKWVFSAEILFHASRSLATRTYPHYHWDIILFKKLWPIPCTYLTSQLICRQFYTTPLLCIPK
jgi:hypothetical protein